MEISRARYYYLRKDIQKALIDFSKEREIAFNFNGSFGKRPDVLEYENDFKVLIENGVTSFHCSEELWKNPLELKTELGKEKLDELRKGWDLIIDIDSKFLDYSKIAAKLIISALKFHNINNIGLKYSITGDTPVLIKNGKEVSLSPITDVIDLLKKNVKLDILSLGKNKKLKFSKVYDYLIHDDELYKIIHEQSNIPLKVTAHHSVFVFEQGKIIQKKVSELKKGDFLITFNSRRNSLESKNKHITYTFQFGKNQHSMKNFNKKIKITAELMRLIGYYLSEGHVTNIINQTGFSFNKNEKEYIEDCQKLIKKITNRHISIRNPNAGTTQILIHSKEWASFFESFCGKTKNKHLPNFSWRLPKKLFLELFKGYIRGNGYKLGKYLVAMKSVSQRLIRELAWLCKLNGISCSISKEWNKPHKLPNGNVFRGNNIYVLRVSKSEVEINEFSKNRNKFSPYPRDKTFPINGLKKVYCQIKPKMFNYHRNEQMTLKKKCANLVRIKKVITWFKKFKSVDFNEESREIISNYMSLFNSHVGTVQIKSINKAGKNKVYDVSVEETESFFGNNYPVLLHNSGNKGFHIAVPWNAFPKEVDGIETAKLFPDLPRKITGYLKEFIREKLIEEIGKTTKQKSYIKGKEKIGDYAEDVMPDIVLVSPRHLFRMPYSLNEKSGFASIVIRPEQIDEFNPGWAKPERVLPKVFLPDARKDEAKELVIQAMDWAKKHKEEKSFKKTDFVIKDASPEFYPPCMKLLLQGMKSDGRKRALFILLNFLKSLNLDNDKLKEKIMEWNKLNFNPLREGYIFAQLSWFSKKKPVLPPNCIHALYKEIGLCHPDFFCQKIKNPVNYTIAKTLMIERQKHALKRKKQKEF